MRKIHSNEQIEFVISQFGTPENNTLSLRYELNLKRDNINVFFKDCTISLDDIQSLHLQLFKIFNGNHEKTTETNTIDKQLEDIGIQLSNTFLEKDLQSDIIAFKKQGIQFFHLILDDRLAFYLWELLFLDGQFLCETFFMGRTHIKNGKRRNKNQRPVPPKPFKMLLASGLIKNKDNDLACVPLEFEDLINFIDESASELANAIIKNPISKDKFVKIFCDYDLVHYAGHCKHHFNNADKSGLLFSNEQMTPKDIKRMITKKNAYMPLLIFINACQSGNFAEVQDANDALEKTFGLAHEFILSGCKNFIGTFGEIEDKFARHFSLLFYQKLFAHQSIGQALFEARKDFLNTYPNEACRLIYVLYGDPTHLYFPSKRINDNEIPEENVQAGAQEIAANYRSMYFIMFTTILLFAGIIFYKGIPVNVIPNRPKLPEDMVIEKEQIEIASRKAELISQLDEIIRKRSEEINRFLEDIRKIAAQNKEIEKQNNIFDDWSSPPLTLVINFESPLLPYMNSDTPVISQKGILSVIQEQIIDKTVFHCLEIRKLKDILFNLKIKLLTTRPSQRVITLLHAQYFLFLDFEPVNENYHQINMRIVDETSQISKQWNVQISTKKFPKMQSEILCKKLMEHLQVLYFNHFPMKARISDVQQEYIFLNIGKIEGVFKNQIFKGIDGHDDITLVVYSVGDQYSRVLKENVKQEVQKNWRFISEYQSDKGWKK